MFLSEGLRLAVLSIAVVANSILANLVHRSGPKSATNRIFVFLSVVSALWLVLTYLSSTPSFFNHYLWWSRLTVFVAPLQGLGLLLLAHTLPGEKIQLARGWLWLVIGGALVVMLATLSPFVFNGVIWNQGMPQLIIGPAMPLFVLYMIACSAGAVGFLIKKFRQSTGVVRQQARFMMIGIFLMVGLIITTIMIPVFIFNNGSFVSFAPLYVLLFLAVTGAAIMRYNLFDVKIIATEFLVAVLIVTLVLEGFFSGSLQQVFIKIIFAVFVAILGTLLVQSVKKEIKRREEITRLAQALEKANIRLQELDQQKTEFLSIASHQLRTPLSIINGYIELIKDGGYGKVGKKVEEILDNMDQSNARLVKLVDEFLDITRIEQGRTKFVFKRADFRDIIDSTVQELKDRAGQKNMSITWDKPASAISAVVDEEKIRHVIFNFIDNAIKYSEHGAITVTAGVSGAGVEVRVQDQGLGFEKTDEVNFFQKFYRGENVKKVEVTGTGLGLFVCRKFIEAHQGKVWATSCGIGHGSEFGLWVPREHAEGSMVTSTA